MYKESSTIEYMANKKDKKRKNALKKKSTIEALKFQTKWGFEKQYGVPSSLYSVFLETELDYIIELELQEELLSIKGFIDDVKKGLGVWPIPELGDFNHSLVAISLGIAKIADINKFGIPTPWHELIKKKILSIYYPDEIRNQVVEYAKENNYNTSTYLGQPIVKFNHLFIKIT